MQTRNSAAFLCLCATALACALPRPAAAALITRGWFSDGESTATIDLQNGETFRLPTRSGGQSDVTCEDPDACRVTVRSIRAMQGRLTYDADAPGVQTVGGPIEAARGFVFVTTEGYIPRLTGISSSPLTLLASSGFTATIGAPGDQLPQGGLIAYSTRWFSDATIGYDFEAGEEIILGEFMLDSVSPLTSFSYAAGATPEDPEWSATFSVGERYRLSNGLTLDSEATHVVTIPEPESLALLLLGLPCLAAARRRGTRS